MIAVQQGCDASRNGMTYKISVQHLHADCCMQVLGCGNYQKDRAKACLPRDVCLQLIPAEQPDHVEHGQTYRS